MKHSYPLVTLLFLIVLSSGNLFAGNSSGRHQTKSTHPADTTKKMQAPPPQMLTFPVFSDITKIRLNSYAQARYQYFPPDNYDANSPSTTSKPSSFDLRNARIILNGNPLRNFSYRLQVDFAPPTVRALDAYVSYTFNPYLKITAGQQKVPLSWESLRTDYNIQSVSRSQVVEALTARSTDVIGVIPFGTSAVNNNGRDIGVLLSGGVPNTNTQANWLEYSLGAFNGQGINKGDLDKNKAIAGRLVVYPVKQISVGGSFYSGKATYGIDTKTAKDRNRFGFDAEYTGDRILATVEFLQGLDSASTNNSKSAYGNKMGYYGMVEGFIVPRHFSALLKYDFYNPNTDVSGNTKKSTIYSVALNYYFAAYTKFQLQYDYRHEDNGPQFTNDILSAQVQVYF